MRCGNAALGMACLGIGLLVGLSASDIVSAKRFVVFNDAGHPVVLATLDQFGGGRLSVLDASGKEVFAVRDGRVFGASPPSSKARSRPLVSPPAHRIMQLLRVETVEADPEVFVKVERLKGEADKLKQRASSAKLTEKKANEDTKAYYRQLAVDLDKSAKRKLGEALALEREVDTPKQVIYGWDGTREVVLKTDRDLSRVLTQIPHGGFLTWQGMRIALTDEADVFSVSRIEPAAKPPNFPPPPKR